MRNNRPAWWAVVSSACAPVLLVGGWQLAAARQPGGFDPIRETISALASRGATDRWIMTSALAGVGVCHMITAAGLAPAAVTGRALLATGGAATVVLAALPLPGTGDSTAEVPGGSAPSLSTVAAGALLLVPSAFWPASTQRWRSASNAACCRDLNAAMLVAFCAKKRS